MFQRLGKNLTLALLRYGLPIPDRQISRIQEFAQLKHLLNSLAINCVIDAGANQGQTGIILRGLGYQGYIYSFEPLSRNFAVLERVCHKDPHWQSFQLALGDGTQDLPLHVHPTSPAMSSLLSFQQPPRGSFEEIVSVIPLNSIFPSLVQSLSEPRVFLKIDTEGYDLKVFHGASQALPYIRALQAEVFVQPVYRHTSYYLDALKVYESAGFELLHLAPVARTEGNMIVALNALMKHPG